MRSSQYPFFGKALADRQRFNNKPEVVIICVSGDEIRRANNWNKHPNFHALLMKYDQWPQDLQWPVSGCVCLIEWDIGPTTEFIIQIVKCLISAGALSVTVQPLFVNHEEPAQYFDTAIQKWVTAREHKRTYFPRRQREYANVA